MTDTTALKQILVGKHLTQAQAAEKIGLSTQSFNQKLNNKREFTVKEISRMIKLLGIVDPIPIFFASSVDLNSTKEKSA